MTNNILQVLIVLGASLFFFLPYVIDAQSGPLDDIETWARDLSNKYSSIATDILRTEEFQNYLNERGSTENQGSTYTIRTRNGTREAMDLASVLEGIISSKTDLVKNMLSTMEDAISDYTRDDGGSPQYIDSSDPNDVAQLNLASSPPFPVPVDKSQSVIKFAPNVDRTSAEMEDHLFISQNLDSVFRDNVDKTTWQYFGSQQGFQRQFPGREWSQNDDGEYQSFDPRLRPWYVGSTSGPKDVLILFDSSGSMGQNNRMAIAREATKTVLETLTVRDYVNVVMFSDSAEPSDCFSETLVRAIPRNVEKLKEFIDNTPANGGTDFVSAFETAFDVLEESQRQGQVSSCETIILFMTDGEASDPSSVIDNRITNDLPVSIFSYAFGSGAGSAVPRKIACNNNGLFAQIPDGGNLRGQMGNYYQYFAAGINNDEVVWTAPYYDASGLDLIVTASAPVYDRRVDPPSLFGVVGTDIQVSELLFEAYTLEEQKSYAFVVNEEGQVLAHPLLKPPSDYTAPPSYTDIADVENTPEIQTIRSRMINKSPGKTTDATVNRILPVGDLQYEGVRSNEYTASYYYRPIPSGPFSVAVVLANDDQQSFSWNSIGSNAVNDSYYHRIDLYLPDAFSVEGNENTGYTTRDTSTVKIAPRGFQEPYEYERFRETESSVEKFTRYMNGKSFTGSPPQLRPRVLTDIRLSRPIESSWMANYESYIKYQYYGSENGVFRAYPGHNLPKNFDNTLRPWYLRAVANTNTDTFGRLTVSTPYEDAADPNQNIVTISRRIAQPQSSSSALSGVMGVDFNFDTFYDDIGNTVDECRQDDYDCYLVDEAGMLVAHSSFLNDEDVSNVFMAQKEELNDVADYLEQNGALEEQEYSDLQTLQTIKYYKLQTGTRTFEVSNRCRTGQYGIAPLTNTNLYLVVAYNQAPGIGNCPQFSPSQDPIDVCSLPAEQGLETCPAFSLNDQQLANLRGGACDTVNSGSADGGIGSSSSGRATVHRALTVMSILAALWILF
eukprot:gb/GECH01012124.1/.p1 GENE.gb/GECH01012124.1/~~gb/GECH01012124.1/.p1  ORF type:complete len:1008 (+),score=235.65 gb/GECH01012124.1/:1-3024(+)